MVDGEQAGGARPPGAVPGWVGHALLPALNLAAALALSALVVAGIGEDPLSALQVLLYGAFGTSEAIGFTLHYATGFIFTGLAVAVAFHAGLFNIGAEGQAMLGGLGAGLVGLGLGGWPWPLAALLGTAASALFGAAWAFLPGWLQARRGSHIVITTIMFNFIAASLMTWLMVNVLIKPGQQSPESREFDPSTWLPAMDAMLGRIGIALPPSPLNLCALWALACCGLVYGLVWHTRWGFALRTVGCNERAAVYAGMRPARVTVQAMLLSGTLAGFVGLNEILGVQHRLLLNFTGGVGFVGIAVALMGRNHPLGIALAALLFGALYQGGAELSFEFPSMTPSLVVVIQGLVILFAGALEHVFRRRVEALFRRTGSA